MSRAAIEMQSLGDLEEQQGVLASVAECHTRRHAGVIAVTSGKGGVGKTNIAANLAICLAACQKRVVLLDADLGLANLDVIMDINSKYHLGHFLNGLKTLAEITTIGPGGVEVICGASGVEALADMNQFRRQRLIEKLSEINSSADVVIIDTAAGMGKSVMGFCLGSDQVLVVTTPEPTAMTDAYAMIKTLTANNYHGRINMVVNMAASVVEGKRVFQQIAEVARRFLGAEIFDAGVLLHDEKLSDAVKKRVPVVLAFPRSYISASIMALAARMTRSSAERPGNSGFLKKVVNWFF